MATKRGGSDAVQRPRPAPRRLTITIPIPTPVAIAAALAACVAAAVFAVDLTGQPSRPSPVPPVAAVPPAVDVAQPLLTAEPDQQTPSDPMPAAGPGGSPAGPVVVGPVAPVALVHRYGDPAPAPTGGWSPTAVAGTATATKGRPAPSKTPRRSPGPAKVVAERHDRYRDDGAQAPAPGRVCPLTANTPPIAM